MEKYWICLLLLAAGAVSAQQNDDDSYQQLDYRDYDQYDYFGPELHDDVLSLPEAKDDNNLPEDNAKEKFEADYQIEDNRSAQNVDELNDESEENGDGDENGDSEKDIEPPSADETVNSAENVANLSTEDLEVKSAEPEEINPSKNKEEPMQVAEDEAVNKLDDDASVDQLDISKEKVVSQEDNFSYFKPEDQNFMDDIVEETKQILEETDDNFDEGNAADDNGEDEANDKYAEEAAKDILESSQGDLIAEDTVDKVYDDLNEDLEKLMETWRKLNDENPDYVEPEKNADDDLKPDQISEYEEKFGVPYGEKYVLSLREDDDAANNEEKMSDEIDDAVNEEDEKDTEVEKVENKNSKDIENDGEKTMDIKNLEETQNYDDDDGLFKDDPEADDATSEEDDDDEDEDDDDEAVDMEEKLIETGDDGILDVNNSDAADDVNLDAVVSESKTINENVETIVRDSKQPPDTINENIQTKTSPASNEDRDGEIIASETVTPIDVSSLNAEQYDQLMVEYVKAHADELSLNNIDDGETPIRMTLTQEPLVVTSPNYPNPYPTNNVVDWIFTGEGRGIELNITDFFVNGVIGDYVLFNPGGLDASGEEGLVFSHMLNEPRRYRFLDVDQMFVRFVAHQGFSFRRGFQFSVRMVLPPEEDSLQPVPEPESLVPEPAETFTILIGGLTLPEFKESEEAFRTIIAEMAIMYINSNGIDQGLNSTRDVTQITNIGVCNLNWPNAARCSEVTFGVPLVYEDDRESRLTQAELRAMWYLYSTQDPFALRLSAMGMEEFLPPNDSGVLTAWLVAGFGLLVCVVVLALALWRYSCFENYDRMPTYSDRDSVYSEKQGLDLYPTPHQTLPPLFAENEYKWDDGKFEDSTRVDMGGFTNKSYNRDELFDIESDEDVIAPNKHDRNYQPRDLV
ncbi:protein PFC0760c-like isoform X1 [Ostrinia nubilalis]|uniref:protein PFC0760c-like isoform X1 n=1 Tax=Ostrinia nubilalis TaxID=29057 RepID=UPI003082402B